MRTVKPRGKPPFSRLLPSPHTAACARNSVRHRGSTYYGFFFSYIGSKKHTYTPKGDVQSHSVTRLLLVNQRSFISMMGTSQGFLVIYLLNRTLITNASCYLWQPMFQSPIPCVVCPSPTSTNSTTDRKHHRSPPGQLAE